MKFLDLFAGIGGFRLGMEQAGHECVGYVEWDKFARKSYEAIHNTEGEWTANDITTVTDRDLELLRKQGVDCICGGFPCQAFSVAGKRGGFDDTRGTLFFEIARFAKQIKPRLLLLENVKGLLSHDKGNTFGTILHTLDELGYDTEWQVLNSKNFGVPQNRERVFIIGHLRGTSRREVFPIGGYSKTPEINVIGTTKSNTAKGTNCRSWVHDTSGSVGALSATDYKQPKQIMIDGFNTTKEGNAFAITTRTSACYLPSHVRDKKATLVKAVLTPERLEKRQDGRRFKEDGEPMFTLTSQDRHGVYDGFRIRKLTPRECWRLQGFPDWAFDKAAAVNSDSQLYKQAGNSVTVNVIYEIARRLG